MIYNVKRGLRDRLKNFLHFSLSVQNSLNDMLDFIYWCKGEEIQRHHKCRTEGFMEPMGPDHELDKLINITDSNQPKSVILNQGEKIYITDSKQPTFVILNQGENRRGSANYNKDRGNLFPISDMYGNLQQVPDQKYKSIISEDCDIPDDDDDHIGGLQVSKYIRNEKEVQIEELARETVDPGIHKKVLFEKDRIYFIKSISDGRYLTAHCNDAKKLTVDWSFVTLENFTGENNQQWKATVSGTRFNLQTQLNPLKNLMNTGQNGITVGNLVPNALYQQWDLEDGTIYLNRPHCLAVPTPSLKTEFQTLNEQSNSNVQCQKWEVYLADKDLEPIKETHQVTTGVRMYYRRMGVPARINLDLNGKFIELHNKSRKDTCHFM